MDRDRAGDGQPSLAIDAVRGCRCSADAGLAEEPGAGTLPLKSAQIYAESILKTCEFCVASPLACVSGVTGADLKKRIVRIMTEADRAVRQLDYARKVLLCVAALAGVASPIVFGLAHITQVRAQATPGNTNPSQGLAGKPPS